MKSIFIAAVSFGVLFSQSVSAENTQMSPNWTNIEVNFVKMSLDATNKIKPEGFLLKGSNQFYKDYFTIASYAKVEDKYSDINIEIKNYSLGIGNKTSISDKTDLYAMITYNYAKFNNNEDTEGVALTLGAKHIVGNSTELDLSLINVLSEKESSYGLKFSANYFINKNVSINAGCSIFSDVNISTVGVRYSF
jgi:opacity protein-like surface antigen